MYSYCNEGLIKPEEFTYPNVGERTDFATFHMLLWEASKLSRTYNE